MTIGNTLFNALQVRSFDQLNTRISDLQTQISSGKNDPRPSADPIRAEKLSAAQDRQAILNRYASNLNLASSRLSQADTALGQATTVVTRLQQISVQAANSITSNTQRAALLSEVKQLRGELLQVANSKDTNGQYLFAGLKVGTLPFTDTPGGVVYNGDGGQHRLRTSDSGTLATGIDGASAFQAVPVDGGSKSVFGMVDDLMASLSPQLFPTLSSTTAQGQAQVTMAAGRTPGPWSMTIAGPGGSATVAADVKAGVPGPMIDAINAQTATTGVTASLSPDGQGMILTAAGGGQITLSGVAGGDPHKPALTVQPLDGSGAATGSAVQLRNASLDSSALVGAMNAAVTHMTNQQARVGALGAVADQQTQAVSDQQVALKTTISGLADLDIAAAVTKLQALLTTQSAAQQTYVKVTQQNLFSFLR